MKKEIKKLKDFQKWFNKYISRNFGKKCKGFVWNCPACHANFIKEMFNDFVNDIAETDKWFEKQERKPKIIKD